jgi:hypothetical protein
MPTCRLPKEGLDMSYQDNLKKVILSDRQCECGCGQYTRIATKNRKREGVVKGQPGRFVTGHNRRSNKPQYIELDRGYVSDCWIWQRSKIPCGYGVLETKSLDGTWGTVCAHRYMYERKHGPVREGLLVDHLCRQRDCVNPDHLQPVTLTENIRRGRVATLTSEIVSDIRMRYPSIRRGRGGWVMQIAAEYRVSASAIYAVLRRSTWADI